MPAIDYIKAATNDNAWDAAANVKNLKSGQSEDYYKRMFAWQDPDANPETKGAYSFPHHEVDGSGNIGAASIKACQSIIGVLNGGMGGSNTPDSDKQGVYNHAAQHLKDANIEPAELKRSKPSILSRPGVAVRSYAIRDLLASDEGNTITGHAAVFGQRTNIAGWFDEIMEPGALDGCDFTDVMFSSNHNLDKIPLARSRNNNVNSTLQLSVDAVGLAIRASLDVENNMEAKALYSAVQRKDIDGMSFIFVVSEERWEDLDAEYPAVPLRHVNKISKVVEVSAVNWPAYSGTDIAARDQFALDSAAKALESARSKLDSSQNEEQREAQKLREQKLEKEERKKEVEVLKLRAQILAKG
jgi:hypothetical protein